MIKNINVDGRILKYIIKDDFDSKIFEGLRLELEDEKNISISEDEIEIFSEDVEYFDSLEKKYSEILEKISLGKKYSVLYKIELEEDNSPGECIDNLVELKFVDSLKCLIMNFSTLVAYERQVYVVEVDLGNDNDLSIFIARHFKCCEELVESEIEEIYDKVLKKLILKDII